MFLLAVDDDSGAPTVPRCRNTKQAHFIHFGRLPLIFDVMLVGYVAEITEPIPLQNALLVVYCVLGPLAINVQPRQSVCKVVDTIDLDLRVPKHCRGARARACGNTPPRYPPHEYACDGIVVQ
jgi:hypothetical protein